MTLMGAVLLLATTAQAAEDAPARKTRFLAFRASAISHLQSKGSAFSVFPEWSPRYAIRENFTLRGGVGATLLKGPRKLFLAAEGMAYAEYRLKPSYSLALGAGIDYWSGGSVYPVVGAEADFFFAHPPLGKLDRLFGGYSVIPIAGNLTHVFRAGAGVTFE